ncbi:MAG: hypothetical protein LIR50_02160 [Bacillota bacterium]|nr:hypothetical protein [Bacillota bacterium]
MKKSRIFRCILSALIIVCVCSIPVSASVWPFGTSGSGQNPFTAKGFAIKTESGKIQWLYSKFDNGGYDASGNMHMQDGGTTYTGKSNGVQYINAVKADGKPYQLYAFTNRNPLIYNYMFAYEKKSQNGKFTPISNFTSCLGTPIRTSTDLSEFPNGINQQWAIPINNFVFEPGTLYEYGFQQGMQANNGISLVLKGDGDSHYYGYLQFPYNDDQALYDKMKYVEYQFISSYTKVEGKDYYNVNFVPMRFSVQTFADLSTWNATAAKVQSFIGGITQSDYDRGRFSKASIDNLKAELSSMKNKADNTVKYQLKEEADQSITEMTNKITTDMNTAKTETGIFSDMTKLDAELKDANDFYDAAKNNVGTEVGNYKKDPVDALKKAIDTADSLTKEDPQSEIDKAVTDLENAVINVKSSLIQTDKIVLSDFVNGITVTLKRGSVPDNVSLIVTRVDAEDGRYKTYKNSIEENVKEITIFEILLFSGDKKIQASEPMTVQFSVPDSMRGKDISVYLSGDDLKAGKISSLRTENFIILNSSTTGYFSLVSSGQAIASSQNTPEAATTPADNSKPNGDLTVVVPDKASQDKADVTRQTNLATKEKPDEKEKSLDLTSGAGNKTMSVLLSGEKRPQEKITDTVIPVSEVLKKGNPFWLLLSAALLGLFGLVYGGTIIIGKFKKH